MALVIYKPEEGSPATQTQFGIEFGPEPVEVTDPRILFKVQNSPFYEVLGSSPSVDDNPEGYRARHNGGGRFVIVFGDKDEIVTKGLDKAAADAFNALSEADKAAYVEAHKGDE